MKRIAVLTSGGDAPGMNAAIRAVVRAAIYNDLEIFGIKRGYQGMIDGDIIPLNARSVSGIINRGGTILHSARCKDFYEAEGRILAAEQLQKYSIEGIIVIGGDGSYHGAQALHSEHGIRCIGLPGTIDNDIGGTEYTIGFDTALNIAVEAIDRVRDTAFSHDRIFFVEVMGRHSGYIAMLSGIAGGSEEILTPEEPTDIDTLIHRLRTGQTNGKTSSIIVVAEGDDAGNALHHRTKSRRHFRIQRYPCHGHRPPATWRHPPPPLIASLPAVWGYALSKRSLKAKPEKWLALTTRIWLLRPLSEAWECRTQFDPRLLRVAHVLST